MSGLPVGACEVDGKACPYGGNREECDRHGGGGKYSDFCQRETDGFNLVLPQR